MHQAKTFSNKDSNKFWMPIDIIGAADALAISDFADCQALLASSLPSIFIKSLNTSETVISRLCASSCRRLSSWLFSRTLTVCILASSLPHLVGVRALLKPFKAGLKCLINAYSISGSKTELLTSSQATLRSPSFSNSLSLWCCFQRLLKSLLRPIYKSVSSFESTKYIAAVLGNALRQLNGNEGSDRTSTCSNWLSTRLLIVWHSVSELPLTPPIPSAWLSCRLAPNPLDPLLSNLHSSFGLPISCSLPNQPQIPTILTYFDVYLMYVSTIHSLNIKYTQTIGDFVEVLIQTRKHPVGRTLLANSIPRCRGADRFVHLLALFRGLFHYDYRRICSPLWYTVGSLLSHADMEEVA